jgi:hypothetical protein
LRPDGILGQNNTFAGKKKTFNQYLDRRPIAGFLIAKDDTILVERYQYARTDADRLISFSMAKTIVVLPIDIARDH